jgi:hypothetical protein
MPGAGPDGRTAGAGQGRGTAGATRREDGRRYEPPVGSSPSIHNPGGPPALG